MSVTNGTLINVLGAPRSGSTMLDLMLGNDETAFSCGEAYALFRPFRTHHFSLNCPCKRDPCEIWEQLQSIPESELHIEIIRRCGVSIVVDSAKDLNWFIDSVEWARKNNLVIRNVAIWKDPIHLAYSFWKRTGSTRNLRAHCLTYYRRLLNLRLPFVTVNCEELTAEPQEKLRQVCQAVGIRYFEGKERFWEKEHHFLFGSLGTRRQSQSGQSEIKSSTAFGVDFDKYADELRERLSHDTAIKAMVRVLEEKDVGSIADGEPVEWDRYEVPRLPLWYHLRNVKRRFRKSFPQKAPTHYR